jgi:hypothetical protein
MIRGAEAEDAMVVVVVCAPSLCRGIKNNIIIRLLIH